jgi:hypothetical protein
MVDLTSIATTLLGLAMAAVTAAIPILVPALLKRLNVANNADLAGKLENALSAAAGVAYQTAVDRASNGGLANIQVKNAALAAGAGYVVAKMPDTLRTLGVTPDGVRDMVSARLGVLLASDPTVTAVAPVAVRTV